MPQITDQERLLRENILVLVSRGPLDGYWRCPYLRCPRCGYYVLKGSGYDECLCGNIAIDSDMLRVLVRDSPEAEVECFDAVPRETKRPGRAGRAVGRRSGATGTKANSGHPARRRPARVEEVLGHLPSAPTA